MDSQSDNDYKPHKRGIKNTRGSGHDNNFFLHHPTTSSTLLFTKWVSYWTTQKLLLKIFKV